MKIQYMSDLHLEFQKNNRYLKNNELLVTRWDMFLKYGLYHTDIKVRNYYIVGSIGLTDDAQNYLNALCKKYHIPVNYIQVDADNEIHKY